jgi:tellurite methyltransferase
MTNQPADKTAPSETAIILDVRPAADFERGHRRGAVNIPLEELRSRMHELPPRDAPLFIYDADRTRARWARSRLRARQRNVAEVIHGLEWLEAGPVESGASRGRLWRSQAVLVEAVGLARRVWPTVQGCKALDVACGSGRDAVFLAMEGFAVEAWDILPDALERCRDLARRCGVTVAAVCRDVEADPAIPAESYDLICCFNFLHRPLMKAIADGVRPGGLVVYETFVQPQRELYGKPAREAHILRPGELPSWFQGWDVLSWREGLARPRRMTAALVARRPVDPRSGPRVAREKAPGREE